jgi:predicted phosphodiesterase
VKLGILTDIHEHVEYLREALDRFRAEGVDQVIVIGDLFEMGKRLDQTCGLLAEVGAIGVWGNHDYGLCCQPDSETRQRYGDQVIDFMTSLKPRLDFAGCHFTHVEPWLNPEAVLDLWYFEPPPSGAAGRNRIFNAVLNRLLFTGHTHRWLLMTPDMVNDWHGDRPADLSDGRFFVTVGALCEGQFATLDTSTSELVPFSLTSCKS